MNQQEKLAILNKLTHARAFLETHNPECHGWKANNDWPEVDRGDWQAFLILGACRTLVELAT